MQKGKSPKPFSINIKYHHHHRFTHFLSSLTFTLFLLFTLFILEASFMMMNQVDSRSFDNDIDVDKKPKE